ncbi:MAG: alcohol dehydrogenase catalytic domain-containing protein [Rhodospirillales bacterium]|nr:alcohol dehydrogenase catalytic domain-containing protein [Rhodospirillales bacterium]
MKAVVLHAPGKLAVEAVPDPRILAPGDAIVRVRATAICGADLLPFHGLTPGFEAGTILGHEFAGEVVEVGPGVTAVKPGDRVVNTSMISDGTCPSCRAGRVTQCEGRSLFGYSGVYPRLDGGQAELVRVPQADRALRALPETVSDEAAIFLADVLPTGYGAVVRGDVREGDTVVVVGCGPVGLMAVLCAAPLAGRLIAVDGVPVRRELAARLGAEAVTPGDAADAVAAATGGLGADVVIEAAGSLGALDASLSLARGRGVVSVVGAHFEPDYPLDNGRMFERELTLRFSIGDPAADGTALLERLAAAEFDPTLVITHRMPLDDAAEAYRLFDSREATKVVLSA